VQCHTLGVEQVTCYRVETENARAAAARGVPALRYHSRGHGDSGGDFDAVTFESLVEDACAAAAEARRRSGAPRVIWLGVRFGALVAAEALRRTGGGALALWEPVESTRDYFRGMLRNVLFSQVVRGEKRSIGVEQLLEQVERDGHVDVHGYYLHRALYATSRALELPALLPSWAGPTLLVQVQKRPTLAPPHAALIEALRARGARVTVGQVAEEPGWHFIANPAWESKALVAQTVEWLDALA
jgi:pimeloyl-ACP methyl ester carboxylesterase